jgi:PAS domain S-box-containing protein
MLMSDKAESPMNSSDWTAVRLAAIIESSDDAIISKNLDGIIQTWNRGAERIFGYSEEEAVGQPILMLIPAGRTDEEAEILSRLRKGDVIDHFETIRQHKNGSLINISVTISPVRDHKGNIVGASKIARDITAQKQIQAQLTQVTEELRLAKAESDQKVEERTASLKAAIIQMEEFSYTVSHDLRAPLRAMRMYAEAVLEDYGAQFAETPEALDFLQRIIQNCVKLDHMIRDILTFSRTSREGLTLEPLSADQIVADVIDLYPDLQEPKAHVTVRPLGMIVGHQPSLAQVMSNLLTNAIKFVPEGQVPQVEVYAENHGSMRRIVIEDNGIGIDPIHHKRAFGLFERFHQNEGFEGTGVGLAIVAKATQRMRGHVGLESDGKNGSKFWVELPIP